jgi:hypothetical protein
MSEAKGKQAEKEEEKDETQCVQCKEKKNTRLRLCLQCKKVKYCSKECQIEHWTIHKSQCISNEATEFLQCLKHNRRGLLSFLGKQNYGNRDVLMDMFRQIATSTNDPLALRRWSLNPKKIDPIFQWPTNELCHCIRSIMIFEDSHEILELAAGCGLLSARFNEYNRAFSDRKRAIPSNPHNDTEYTWTRGLMTRILNQSFSEIKERSTPVMISFQDPHTVTEFNTMMEQNQPTFLLGIGQPLLNKDRDMKLIEFWKKQFNYSVTVLTPKQICHLDRPMKEKPDEDYDCRSVVHYWRREKPPLSNEELVRLCGSDNLGSSKAAGNDVTSRQLREQDYFFNMKHDPELKLSCAKVQCTGCPYKFPDA